MRKNIKVSKTDLLGTVGALGCYNIYENTIFYDYRLDSLTELKEKVLAHEFKHANHKFNLFYHLYIDFVDFFRLTPLKNKLDDEIISERKDRLGKKDYIFIVWVDFLYSSISGVLGLFYYPLNIFLYTIHIGCKKK